VCWAPIPPPGCHIVDPWFAHADVYWVVVRSDHFTANDVGRYKERTLRPSPGVSVDVARRAPERGVIEKRTGKTIREINVDVRKISTEGRALQRPKLPPDQERAVDRYQERNPRSGGDKTPVTKEKSPSSSEKKAKPESKKEEKSKQRDSNTPKKEKKKG